MKIDDIILQVKSQLTVERFEHTLRVRDTAAELAQKYGEDKDKIEIAAVCHDYAKYRPLDEMKRWIIRSTLPKDLLHYHHELWHGPVGAILSELELGIKNPGIQSAIHYHTTGRANMSKMEMIIFLADYIEPGRQFPGVQKVRDAAEEDLLKACWMTSRNTVRYLMEKNTLVYPDSFHAYNDLTRKINGGH